jgi:hypothetical protein
MKAEAPPTPIGSIFKHYISPGSDILYQYEVPRVATQQLDQLDPNP